ncbi:hypothetical protein D3C86_1401240 [compost metagenome]
MNGVRRDRTGGDRRCFGHGARQWHHRRLQRLWHRFRRRDGRGAAGEQALEQARTLNLFVPQYGQGLLLQGTQFGQQQRQLTQLIGTPIELLGVAFQRLAHFPRQVQVEQLVNQRHQRSGHLADPLLAPLLGVQHGLFQARNQRRESAIHVVAAQDLAQLLHALIDRLIGALGCQAAAHQPPAQQVDPGIPAPFEDFLLFEAGQVLVFPALGVVVHCGFSRAGRFGSGGCGPRSVWGRRISTATGR